MKQFKFFLGAASLLTASLLLTTSCKPSQKSGEAAKDKKTSPAADGKAIVSAEANSFDEVTSKLDKGGNFYLYLSTEQWLTGVSEKVGGLRDFVLGLPQAKTEDHDKIEKGFRLVEDLVKESGIEQVSGVGISSIAREPGFYHSKFIVHHYKGKNDGFLWSMFGKEPHALEGLNFLPTTTAAAGFSDLDIRLGWTVLTNEMMRMEIPEVEKALTQMPAQFEKQAGMSWDELLGSLGGEYGMVLTLDESKKIALPFGKQGMQVPEPGLMIVAKVKGDAIFNRIEEAMKSNKQIIRVDKGDLKMRTMPFPLPLPIQLRPTVARSGDYLFIATTDTIINEALAVKKGEKPGWKSTDEYKKLSQGLPTQGNSFFLISPRLGQTVVDVQKQLMASEEKLTPSQTASLQRVFGGANPMFSFTVGANTDEGWQAFGNGNQSASTALVIPGAAAGGLLAAIAIPNFVKAREKAQMNACINNLRQIDGAKEQWAIENNKKSGDMPTGEQLWGAGGYIRAKPKCPAGGTYTINAVGTNPTCSHTGHVLPE